MKLPLLRKDFIIEELQIHEAAAYGADAVLLVAAILDDQQLREFRAVAEYLRMAALVEVHDEGEVDRAVGPFGRYAAVRADQRHAIKFPCASLITAPKPVACG